MDNITFEKLSPTTDADVKVYKEAFDFVFSNNDVRNVAISGAYGAGKSSILESYKKSCQSHWLKRVLNFFVNIFTKKKSDENDRNNTEKNKPKRRKYIHISLAHFEDLKNGNNEETKETGTPQRCCSTPNAKEDNKNRMSQEALLEGKILNQLIHQIPSRKIPQTHFRVKRTVHWWSILIYSVAALVFLLSLCHILLFSSWQGYLQSLPSVANLLQLTINPYSRLVTGGILGLIGGLLIYALIKAQTNRSIFRKLNVNGTEIEIFENSDESYFDKYLNEVLYLFEQVDADVIVFEDIDRYDDIQIFERLREVNTLVNLQPQRRKKPLRFFYMLRDDIFESKDRTKFFDFIIPVVPVIDGSNAYNQFKTHLIKNNLFENFDSNFLQRVARYVDEMRLLKNICNEFLVYFNRMTESVELNYNKMFAMVIYKNLFPKDFCELQLGRGFVASLFKNKAEFIKERKALIQKQIDEIVALEESAKNEVAEKQQELELIFKPKVNSSYRGYEDWYSRIPAPYKADYENRSLHIGELKETRLKQLQKERRELEGVLSSLNSSKLSEIIVRENANSIFSFTPKNELGVDVKFDDVRINPYFNLLKFLIREGYIDETYSDYMTYFYTNSLSSTDKNFLLSVTDKEAKEYNYELNSPNLIFENLREIDFDEEETMNFSLLSYLLTKQTKSEHLKRLIGQLREKKVYGFIYQYYVLNVNTKEFVCVLNEQWPAFFSEMTESPLFTKDVIKSYIITTLYYSNSDALNAVNGEIGILSNHISNDKGFLNIERPEISKLIKAFSYLDIKFKELDYSASDKELFAAVYENNLYEFNYANIALMLKNILGTEEDYEIIHKNYTLISQNEGSPLLSYVKDNFSIYIDLVMDNCNEAIDDSEPIACEILNHEELKKEQKQRYIELLVTKIENITSVKEKSYWSTLVSHECVLPTWENIFSYYSYIKKVNSELIDFINSSNKELTNEVVKLFDETLSELGESVVDCNELDDDKYAAILVKSGVTFDTFDYQDVSENKISIIINNNIVNLNEETLDSFRENYPTLTLDFIRANLGKYLNSINYNSFDYQEMLQILTWNVPDKDKIELIKITDEPISIIGKNYSDTVAVYILKHNLEDNDMKILLETYDDSKTAVGNYVFSYAKSNIADIVNHNMKISVQLRDDILSDSAVEPVEKATIIKHTVSDYEKDKLIVVLNAIGFEKVSEALIDNKQPRIPINEENELLLDAFKSRGWISDYEENPNIPNCYKVIREKKSKKLASHLL